MARPVPDVPNAVPNPFAEIRTRMLRIQKEPDRVLSELFIREGMAQVAKRGQQGLLADALDAWTGDVTPIAQVLTSSLRLRTTELVTMRERLTRLLAPYAKKPQTAEDWLRRSLAMDGVLRWSKANDGLVLELVLELEERLGRLEPDRVEIRKVVEKILVGAEPLSRGGKFLSVFRNVEYKGDQYLPDVLDDLADSYAVGTVATQLRVVAKQISRGGISPFHTLGGLKDFLREEGLDETQAGVIASQFSIADRLTDSGWEDLRSQLFTLRRTFEFSRWPAPPLDAYDAAEGRQLRELLSDVERELAMLDAFPSLTEAAVILGAPLLELKRRGVLPHVIDALREKRTGVQEAQILLLERLTTPEQKAVTGPMIEVLDQIEKARPATLGLAAWLEVFQAVDWLYQSEVDPAHPDVGLILRIGEQLSRLDEKPDPKKGSQREQARDMLKAMAGNEVPLWKGGAHFTRFDDENYSTRFTPALLKVVAQRYQTAAGCVSEGPGAVQHRRRIHGLLVKCADQIANPDLDALSKSEAALSLLVDLHRDLEGMELKDTRAYQVVDRFRSADLATSSRFDELRRACSIEAITGEMGSTNER